MGKANRRVFLGAFGATALAAAASAVSERAPRNDVKKPWKSLIDFHALADGKYDPIAKTMSGTDNTAAINAALASGHPVWIPPGRFYYSGMLHTHVSGSGLIGSGSGISQLITDRSLQRHISVVAGAKDTRWTNFGMIGPSITDGSDYNRALTIGVDRNLENTSASAWDARGTWIDDFVTHGYCVGVHVAAGANVEFGTIEVYEAGNSRAEPGAYGISCSGSNLRGRVLRAVNTTTRARHALYFTGPANDCFVDEVYAVGFDLAAMQNRCTAGGGQRNGFGHGRFEDCNTNPILENTLRGVVNFSCANDVVVEGAGGARIGDYEAINCGGFPGPSLRYMPNSDCGVVRIYGHAGLAHFSDDHYGSEIYRSDNVRLPKLVFESGFDASGLDDPTFRPLVITDSVGCYGGGVDMQPGAVYAAESDSVPVATEPDSTGRIFG